jgi:hypothetical protein
MHEHISLYKNGKNLKDFTGTIWYEFHPGILDLACKIARRHIIVECNFCNKRLSSGFIRQDGTVCCSAFVRVTD